MLNEGTVAKEHSCCNTPTYQSLLPSIPLQVLKTDQFILVFKKPSKSLTPLCSVLILITELPSTINCTLNVNLCKEKKKRKWTHTAMDGASIARIVDICGRRVVGLLELIGMVEGFFLKNKRSFSEWPGKVLFWSGTNNMIFKDEVGYSTEENLPLNPWRFFNRILFVFYKGLPFLGQSPFERI